MAKKKSSKPKVSTPSQTSVREQKRQQFTETSSNRSAIIGVAAVIAVIAVSIIAGTVLRNDKTAPAAAAATTAGGDVTIAVADVSDGQMHIYANTTGGKGDYFVMADKNGKLHSALNACEVCGPAGYKQIADGVIQCQKCMRTFKTEDVGILHGGCDPIPLDSTVDGKNLVIAATAL